jgi:hypothetical protein
VKNAFLASAAVAGALLFCGPAGAVAAAAAPQPAVSSEAEGEQWIGRVAAWMQGTSALMAEQAETLSAVAGGVRTAEDYFSRHDAKGGAAWAADWAKARRLQLETYRQDTDTVFNAPLPPLTAGLAHDPTAPGIAGHLHEFVGAARQHMQGVSAMAEELVQLIEKTAGGDADAAREVGYRAPEIVIAMIRGECDMLTASRLLQKPGDPQSDLVTANIESNLAMIEMLSASRDRAAGTAKDVSAYQARMRQHALASEAAADQMTLDARSFARTVVDNKTLNPAFLARLQKAADTFADSAEVERSIGAALVIMADGLDMTDAASVGRTGAAGQSLGGLVAKRLELDRRRKRILAGQE